MTSDQKSLLVMPKVEIIGKILQPTPPSRYSPPSVFPAIHKAKRIVIDLETYDPELFTLGPGWRRDAFVVGIGINADNQFKEYYPVRHLVGPNCNEEKVWAWLRDELNNYRGELVGANITYDGDGLQQYGVRPWKAKWHDIQLAEPLLDEYAVVYNLQVLAQKYLREGKRESELDKLYGPEWKDYIRQVHPGHLKPYVIGDLELPFRILDAQLEALGKEGLTKLYDLESRLAPILLYMRQKGVRVDLDAAEKLRDKLVIQAAECAKEASRIVGFEVNFNAAASMDKAFREAGIKTPLTAKGNPSIKNEWLEAIGWKDWDKRKIPAPGNKAVLARNLVLAREYDRLKGTFIESYILEGHINGRIHCELHPLRASEDGGKGKGTVTGRFSSSNPNLQNIPIHSELGKLMRAMFIPNEGKLWFSQDWSQIEYRFLVHFAVMCKCRGAKEAQEQYLRNPDTDYHKMVEEMTGLDRNKYAKTLNFMLVFGGGKDKLAREIGEADSAGRATPKALEIFDTYHKKNPYVKEMLELAARTAEERGYVKTILGRRGRFNLWEPKYGAGFPLPYQEAIEKYGERIKRSKTYKALNKIIQGSAADMMKQAMVNAWDAGLFYEGGPLDLGLTVHDELDGSVEPSARGKESLAALKRIMENAIPLCVPVLTDGKTGKNWAEAH